MIVAAMVGGTLCTCIAAATPLADLRPTRALNAIYGTAGQPGQSISACSADGSRSAPSALVLDRLHRRAAVAGDDARDDRCARSSQRCWRCRRSSRQSSFAADQLERLDRAPPLVIPVGALRAAPVRSLALAATCAVAVCGALAIGGARDDLLDGLDQSEYYGTADIWVSQRGDALGPGAVPASARDRRRFPAWRPSASTPAACSTSATDAPGSSPAHPRTG